MVSFKLEYFIGGGGAYESERPWELTELRWWKGLSLRWRTDFLRENRLRRVESGWIWIKLEHATLLLKPQGTPISPSKELKSFLQPPGPCYHLVTAASPPSPPTSLPLILLLQPGHSWDTPTHFCLRHLYLVPHPGILTLSPPPWLIASLPSGFYSNASLLEGPPWPRQTKQHAFSHCRGSSILSFPYLTLFFSYAYHHRCLFVYGLYAPLI